MVLNALKETEQALTTYDAELPRHAALVAGRDDNQRRLRPGPGPAAARLDQLPGPAAAPSATSTTAKAELAASDQALVDDQVAVFQSLGGGWQDAPPVVPPKAP